MQETVYSLSLVPARKRISTQPPSLEPSRLQVKLRLLRRRQQRRINRLLRARSKPWSPRKALCFSRGEKLLQKESTSTISAGNSKRLSFPSLRSKALVT